MSDQPTHSGSLQWQALFVFQCKGIQPFVMGSDRLKDMVGATEIVSQLPESRLDEVIDWLGLKQNSLAISQAAGSARVLFRTLEDARKLKRVWPMICAHAAPGMEAVQTVVEISGGDYLAAVNEAERNLVEERNHPAVVLPEIMPSVLRAGRTGQPVVEMLNAKAGENEEPLDAATRVKRRARRARQDSKNDDLFPEIYKRFGFEKSDENLKFVPEMMEQIAGNDRSFVAVLHADGNGMGAMFIRLEVVLKKLQGFDAPEFYRALSRGIIEVGDKAAQAARLAALPRLEELTKASGKWPFLPIVLAGDDLTVVMRAELAVPFASSFLQNFECQSRELFARLLADERFKAAAEDLRPALGACLTAGAGIAFVKPRYPFALAYHLTESLAGFAKREAKKRKRADELPPSTLAFHKVVGDVVRESFDDLREGRSATGGGKERESELRGVSRILLSLAPYVVGENATDGDPLPTLGQLEKLADSIAPLPRGQVRELVGLLRENLPAANRHFDRFIKQAPPDVRLKRMDFAAALDTLLGTTDHKCHHNGCSPLLDAWTLAGLALRKEDDEA